MKYVIERKTGNKIMVNDCLAMLMLERGFADPVKEEPEEVTETPVEEVTEEEAQQEESAGDA